MPEKIVEGNVPQINSPKVNSSCLCFVEIKGLIFLDYIFQCVHNKTSKMQCKKSKTTNQNPPKHQNFTSSPILCDFLKSNDLRMISGLTVTSPKGRIAGCGCYRNLDPIVLFPGGESLRGFILVTVLVEKAAVPGIKALVQAVNAVLLPSPDSLLQALQQLRLSIQDITRALGQMHDYVDPDIFYAVIRIFFSGWKDNPAMPAGLLYEGVSKEPLHYSGASAAQSTVLHAFDEFLGVRHSKESADFLHRMRDYMPPSHRAFIEEIHSAPSLRDHILSSGNSQLLTAYNQCVEALAALRSYHLAMVTKYLITAAPKAKGRKTSHLPGPPQALEERGTGGTAVVRFLKSVRDKTIEAILHQSG
ncbi:indoleamine 2,3-dioxygenase 2 isoform X4 [Delphinus delphis]|uniref:indoleamine 2,3-dioxygenase 2 isoform X4 n=1 Tax=Delphinus delphis TaxID=9728 RepID=UPI0028C38F90|nr:indoleamine 2,3-dioxygenase 2 isoform X4 [Delphinus delphis]XP_059857399.1 indoleamine 2,3-dioxygenase 2 isoform X4 [Delphinus delphis]XP_059857400.1 indoleamine 2,3-dioxygenase 2 isoform X4 [Delphinus delphis]